MGVPSRLARRAPLLLLALLAAAALPPAIAQAQAIAPAARQTGWDTVALGLFCLLEALAIVALLVSRHRRHRAESEARYRGIVEDQTELICRFLPDGTFTFVNGAYCRYFRRAPEQLLGRTFWEFIPAEGHQGARDFLASIAPEHPVASREHEVLAPDGEIRWQQWRDRGYFDRRGRVVEYQAVGRDITDLKQAEEGRRQLEAQKQVETALRQADSRKDEFIAMLGHELRNPLAAVTTALEVVRHPDLGEDKISRARDVIGRQIGQLSRLVDDLLDVSRITRGTIHVRRDRLDVRTALAQAIETSRPLIAASAQELATEIPSDPLFVTGDVVRLAQIVSNLLNNAAKYTGPRGTIHLGARREGAEVVLVVRDSGMGIPADMIHRVFEPFVQAEGARARAPGGLGIGLTLVKRLVELHGGRVAARSAGLGLGSEFRVHLPLAPEVEDDAAADPRPTRQPARAARIRRILVVDDNADAADTLAHVLGLEAHEVHTAHDGPAALAAAERFDPDVVLLDIGMPTMDGLQVARSLRQGRCRPGVLLIATTGYGQAEDRRRSAEAGFDLHLIKPIDVDVLKAAIDEAPARAPSPPGAGPAVGEG